MLKLRYKREKGVFQTEEFRGMPYKQIRTVTNKINDNSREIRLLLGVVDSDAPYLLHYDVLLRFPAFCDPKWKVRDFLG